ncbi:WD40 repeat domain-containing protein [Streptomyces olivaceoviridis]|uniref:WD40 repeat domain-containing protein n=1 Tax=Streptomyces olivaceoviridis TaxID=1921 RepID=UPI003689BB98
MAGRREVPVDPGAGPVQRFAFELRKLRAEAGGVTYRVLADRAGYSITTLSQAAGGERLPTLAVVLAYAAACGGEAAEWEARWKQAVDEVAVLGRTEDGQSAEPPYKGLVRFETGDSDRFFGRDRLTADLLDLLLRQRFAAVFGPSGSGKSSLLRAGLIPALQRTQMLDLGLAALCILTPGPHPARTHAWVLDPDATRPGTPGADTFVIVDQFEEVFTLCHDPAERTRFLDLLLTARQPESRLRVLIAVRADFYGRCAEHHGLADALRDANLLVGPMTPAELRDAIVKPATAAGLTVERALTSRLVEEVAHAPGGLPLLSHVLMETWRRRRGKTMTLASYQAAGGIEGAVAKTAEDTYRQFTEAQAAAARRILLRLVAPGDGTPDTRRPTHQDELEVSRGQENEQESETGHVLRAFTRSRLLTLDGSTVELAHEALLTAWPRLRGWIEQDRERLRVHRELTDAAHAWEELGRDPGALYRGNRMTTAQEHFSGGPAADLTDLEHTFLTASLTAHDQEVHAATRVSRRLRLLTASLSILLALAVTAGLTAWQQSRSHERERLRAEARRIAEVADGMRFEDPHTAMLLSLASWKIADLPETRSALLAAAWQKEQDAFAVPDDDPTAGRFLDLDGRTVISVGEHQVTQWDLATRRKVASYQGLGRYADDYPEVSVESRVAVLNGSDGVRLWDLRAGGPISHPVFRNMTGQMNSSGRTVIVYGMDRSMQLREIRSGRLLAKRRAGALTDGPFIGKVSADDRLLAVCRSVSARLEIYDLHDQKDLTAAKLSGAQLPCRKLRFVFTRDNRALLTLTDTKVQIWDINSGRLRHGIKHPGIAEAVLSPNGKFLATADDSAILVWRLAAPSSPVFRYALVGETAASLRWAPGGRVLRYLAGVTGATVRSLDVEPTVDPTWTSRPVSHASFSADGRILTTVKPLSGTIRARLHDLRKGRNLATADLPCPGTSEQQQVHGQCTGLLALAPDGRSYAVGATDKGRQTTVTVAGRERSTTLTISGAGRNTKPVADIELSPDGRLLYVPQAIEDQIVTDAQLIPDSQWTEIWSVGQRRRTRILRGVGGDVIALRPDGKLLATSSGQLVDLPSGRVTRRTLAQDTIHSLAFSSNGDYLAVGDASGRVTVWDRHARQRLAVFAGTPRDTSGSPEPASALSFSHDAQTLAVVDTHGTTQLWDITSKAPYGPTVPGASDTILALAFSPDNQTLYAAGDHATLQKHTIAPEKIAAAVCQRTRTLTATEWKAYIPTVPYRPTC